MTARIQRLLGYVAVAAILGTLAILTLYATSELIQKGVNP